MCCSSGGIPDDVEWGVVGIALLLREQSISFAIADLTQGEMGSRGTVDGRAIEAARAAAFLGASARENLNLPDVGLIDSPESRRLIAGLVRQYRPKIVLAPLWEDRHPDHAAAGLMVRNPALYCAGPADRECGGPGVKKDIWRFSGLLTAAAR